MNNNFLITGYWGEPHVTAENDRGINAAMFGTGRFVLPVGEQFRAEYIGNNTIRMYDGKLMNNGAAAGIPAGEYVDLLVTEAGQGMNRNDIIVFQYEQDASTLIERGTFVVVKGTETSGTASDPELTQEDLLSGNAKFDQMALWRVHVSSTVISDPVQLFEVSKNITDCGVPVVEAISSDGAAYSASVPGVTELFAGLEVTIVPNVSSTTTAITLDVNGLGAKYVRLPVSTNTAMLAQPDTESYYVEKRPVKLMYDPNYAGKGSWVVVGKQQQSVHDLYGSVPVQKGGFVIDNNTTEEDKAEALENLLSIGLAPGGHGLGDTATLASDCNTAIVNGWYYANATTENKPTTFTSTNCAFFVVARNASQIYQYFYHPSDGGVLQRYTANGGSTWTEEWLNPPMVADVEYRTTERMNGKAVYKRITSSGVLEYRLDGESEWKNYAVKMGGSPAYTYGTEDIEAGSASPYETGHLHFVYEA